MSVLLFVSAGRGPQECAWALGRLVTRLERDAARHGVTVARVESVPGERPGTWRSMLLSVADPAFAATWTGTLCWQAPSPYRSGAGRKNWYVTARLVRTGPVAAPFDERDVDVVACRTGGPGGQHRNKASTAARATHRPSGIVVVADRERHFALNRQAALALIRRRLGERNEAAEQQAVTARWRVHDELERGDPVRVERP